MKKIVSGITATGKLTIGNYLGAIKHYLELQDEYDMYIFVADLHALTIDISPSNLLENKKNIMGLYLASGLDPQKVNLFFQSDVPAHGQMCWLVQNLVGVGELERMTQYKDKAGKVKLQNQTVTIKSSLLTYPTLMAGDILLYNPSLVPVGEDQRQHLELTRNIAKKFNQKYGPTFTIPNPYICSTSSKIMSLTNPFKKMSKSDTNPKSSIFLLDDPELAFQKIKKAVTDSENKVYFSKNKPGVSNLLTIYAGLTNTTIKKAEKKFINKNYGEFKEIIGQIVKSFLEKLQMNFRKQIPLIKKVALEGAQEARKETTKMMKILEKKIGLRD